MKCIIFLAPVLFLIYVNAKKVENITQELLNAWLAKNSNHNFLVAIDVQSQRETYEKEKVVRVLQVIPKTYAIVSMNYQMKSTELADRKLQKASFIIIFSNVYDSVSKF
jgi:hypothetical protein